MWERGREAKRERLGRRPHFLSPKPVCGARRLSPQNPAGPRGATNPAWPAPGLGLNTSGGRPQPNAESAGGRRAPDAGRRTPLPSASPTLPGGVLPNAGTLTWDLPPPPRLSAPHPQLSRPPRPLLRLLRGPDPSLPPPICH